MYEHIVIEMTTLATVAYEKRCDKGNRVYGDFVSWFEPNGGEKYKKGDWEKKQLFVDVPGSEDVPYVCERITSQIWELRKKPRFGLFRGTKEIVFAGYDDPLKNWERIAEIIQKLRKQGWKGKISMETSGEIETSGSVLQPPFNIGYERTTRTDYIIRDLECSGLNKIHIFTRVKLPRGKKEYEAGVPNETVRFIEYCMRYKLDTHVYIGLPNEQVSRYWEYAKCMFNAVIFRRFDYGSPIKSKLITLKPDHLTLKEGYTYEYLENADAPKQ